MDELTLVARLRDDVPAIDLAGPERRLAGEISRAANSAGTRPGGRLLRRERLPRSTRRPTTGITSRS
jgi:hypothetical protein